VSLPLRKLEDGRTWRLDMGAHLEGFVLLNRATRTVTDPTHILAVVVPGEDGSWLACTQVGGSYSGRRYKRFATFDEAGAYLKRWLKTRFRAVHSTGDML